MNYPSAVVFDLDYTLWPCWCDTHIPPPLKPVSRETVSDRSGYSLSLYPDIAKIIQHLEEKNIPIIAASRTATPHVAKQLLRLFHIDEKPLIDYFACLQFGEGSKQKHIAQAARELKLQSQLKQGHFILFDDELRNRDVEKIGCHFAHVPDGLTHHVFESELKAWNNKVADAGNWWD